ncbi:MAG: hypothetical protein Q7R76_00555 [Candidatus Woesearchaeota archaeon]|nr:hypothetical protein [Candidatus Woesearchaeota archaeon]
MLFDWLTDPDSSLQQIRTAFVRVKHDLSNVFGWTRYLYHQQHAQERKIEQLEQRMHELERDNFKV